MIKGCKHDNSNTISPDFPYTSRFTPCCGSYGSEGLFYAWSHDMKRWIFGAIKEDCDQIPKEAGCYAIYAFDGFKQIKLIYIGSTGNLRRRIHGHEIVRCLKALTEDYIHVKYKIIKDRDEMLTIEKKLIKRIKPKANIVGNSDA
jgi:hypothetical protein